MQDLAKIAALYSILVICQNLKKNVRLVREGSLLVKINLPFWGEGLQRNRF